MMMMVPFSMVIVVMLVMTDLKLVPVLEMFQMQLLHLYVTANHDFADVVQRSSMMEVGNDRVSVHFNRKVFAVVLDLKSEVLVRLQMMLVNVMLLLPLPFVLVVQHERVLVTELSVKMESDVVMIMMMSHELNTEGLVVALYRLAVHLNLRLVRNAVVDVDSQRDVRVVEVNHG